ncbi:hypothetical protein F4775DRAFT_233915 [Biscogniauxia sp. FL1348]|nr:hypothetical protein F4775DRAFT_233915 [Biscogniauxia sp. FL1348]
MPSSRGDPSRSRSNVRPITASIAHPLALKPWSPCRVVCIPRLPDLFLSLDGPCRPPLTYILAHTSLCDRRQRSDRRADGQTDRQTDRRTRPGSHTFFFFLRLFLSLSALAVSSHRNQLCFLAYANPQHQRHSRSIPTLPSLLQYLHTHPCPLPACTCRKLFLLLLLLMLLAFFCSLFPISYTSLPPSTIHPSQTCAFPSSSILSHPRPY